MLSDIDIRKLAMKSGVPAGVVEKDYVITKFLYHLRGVEKDLVFKGGTAIKKAYIEWMRFSEDLDFISLKKSGWERGLGRIFKDIDMGMKTKDVAKFRLSRTITISFVGPLGYKNSFKLDFSMREKPLLKPQDRNIVHFYPDIPKFSFPVLALDEILAEKLRALYTRGKARDVLDVFYLSNLRFSRNTVKRIFAEKLKTLQVYSIDESRFRNTVKDFNMEEIMYLMPPKPSINRENVIKSVLKGYAFLFR